VRGGTIVVDGVPAQIILRAGKQLATLTVDESRRGAPAPSDGGPVAMAEARR
jgi:hypothetical protein